MNQHKYKHKVTLILYLAICILLRSNVMLIITLIFCAQLLDERQSINVWRYLQAIDKYDWEPHYLMSVFLVRKPRSYFFPVFIFIFVVMSRRHDITDGLKKLKCRTLIFVGDSSPFHSEALHMTGKLDRRYSALVEVYMQAFIRYTYI